MVLSLDGLFLEAEVVGTQIRWPTQPNKPINYVDWSKGCVRNKPLNYSRQDGFMKFTELKLPDATPSWVSKSMNLKECREKCLENSSCMAYTNSDITRGGSGCVMWFGDLIDMRNFQDGGQDLYIRMSASELGGIGLLVYVAP